MASTANRSTDRRTGSRAGRRGPSDEVLDAVLDGAKVVSGIIARSLTQAEASVTLPQLRVLVVTGERSVLSMAEVAEIVNVHPSNATRLVDRLVHAGLLDRRDDPQDRRQLRLTLTDAGNRLVSAVLDDRREAFRRLLSKLSADAQAAIGAAMSTLASTERTRTDQQTWVVPVSQRQG